MLIHIDKPRAANATRLVKGLFDIVGAAAILLAFSPLLAIAALRIKLHDGGPVVPPGPRRQGRRVVRLLQSPHHGGARR